MVYISKAGENFTICFKQFKFPVSFTNVILFHDFQNKEITRVIKKSIKRLNLIRIQIPIFLSINI